MIKLQSGAILLQSPAGGLEFLDLDGLHDCLWACCRQVGVDDAELPGDIVNVVLAFSKHRQDLKPQDVDQLVTKILFDSGLRDLAEEFAYTRESGSISKYDEMLEPSEEIVSDVLHNEPFFLAKPISQLSTMVMVELEKLGFAYCSRSLMRELARTTWYNLQEPQSSKDYAGYWLLKRQDVATLFHDEALRLLTKGLVQIQSISSLFPAILVKVELLQIAEGCGPELLPELQLFPELDRICAEVLTMREALEHEVLERLDGYEAETVPSTVAFLGIDELTHQCYPRSSRKCKALRDEISAIIRSKFDHRQVEWELA